MCASGGLGFHWLFWHSCLISSLNQWNPTYANIVLGMASAVIDNISPVMVLRWLTMQPEMSHGHWLLIT